MFSPFLQHFFFYPLCHIFLFFLLLFPPLLSFLDLLRLLSLILFLEYFISSFCFFFHEGRFSHCSLSYHCLTHFFPFVVGQWSSALVSSWSFIIDYYSDSDFALSLFTYGLIFLTSSVLSLLHMRIPFRLGSMVLCSLVFPWSYSWFPSFLGFPL